MPAVVNHQSLLRPELSQRRQAVKQQVLAAAILHQVLTAGFQQLALKLRINTSHLPGISGRIFQIPGYTYRQAWVGG
jgi:hypothetical protein